MRNIRNFYLKIFIFLLVKFSVCLNRRVFVMSIFSDLSVIFHFPYHKSENHSVDKYLLNNYSVSFYIQVSPNRYIFSLMMLFLK